MHFMYETSIPVHVSDLGLALKVLFFMCQVVWPVLHYSISSSAQPAPQRGCLCPVFVCHFCWLEVVTTHSLLSSASIVLMLILFVLSASIIIL